jgi:hypothetical protein
MMKIKKLFGSLNENGLEFGIGDWEFIRETNMYYEIKSEVKTKRLKKDKLNTIYSDTKLPYISFISFCEEDKINGLRKEMVRMMGDELIKQERSVVAKRESLRKYLENQ